ncbi:MAG: permease-like cell division protein FtsX [Nocardioidaceae bacterium]
MQLRYVASELGTGLKRNVSMTIAVILTIWMSLTLVGLGLLMRSQVTKIEHYFGSQLEVQVVFCAKNSQTDTCVGGQASSAQEGAVRQVIADSPEMASFRYQTREQSYQTFQATHTDGEGQPDAIAQILKVSDMSTGYWVKFKDPDRTQALITSVNHLPGVEQIIDIREELDPVYRTLNMLKWMALGAAGLLVLAAVLQVSNTIRLAAMARRREIGIMRLVGASSLYIQLPFVLEVIFSALVGAALACGTLAVVVKFFIPWLHRVVQLWQWVSWSTAIETMVWMVVIALALAIVPTVLMTRKYLRV